MRPLRRRSEQASEKAPFNEIVARYLKVVGDPREVVCDPEARYWGGLVDDRSLVPLGEARLGRIGLGPFATPAADSRPRVPESAFTAAASSASAMTGSAPISFNTGAEFGDCVSASTSC